MKTTIGESDFAFWIEMDAETLAEAAMLARMGMNTKARIHFVSAYAKTDGISAHASFRKHSKKQTEIKRK